MTNRSIGTKEQDEELRAALQSLKNVKGPLMMAMQKAQAIYGYLPVQVQLEISEALDIPLTDVYGTATFYSQFRLTKPGQNKIGVCMGTACYVRGSGDIIDKFKERLGVQAGETTSDGKFTLEATRCIGCCGLAPVLTVNEEVYGKVDVAGIDKILAKYNQ